MQPYYLKLSILTIENICFSIPIRLIVRLASYALLRFYGLFLFVVGYLLFWVINCRLALSTIIFIIKNQRHQRAIIALAEHHAFSLILKNTTAPSVSTKLDSEIHAPVWKASESYFITTVCSPAGTSTPRKL